MASTASSPARRYRYRPAVMEELGDHGLRPLERTAPALVRDALNDLYTFELRIVLIVAIGTFVKSRPALRRAAVTPSSRIWAERNDGYFSSSIMWAAMAPHVLRVGASDFVFAMLILPTSIGTPAGARRSRVRC